MNSQRTTLFHWFSLSGRSRHDLIQRETTSYIIVSDVGLTASLSSSFEWPASVTHATSGAKPAMCSDSLLRSRSGMNSGKYAFWMPTRLNSESTNLWTFSQIAYPEGLRTRHPETGL